MPPTPSSALQRPPAPSAAASFLVPPRPTPDTPTHLRAVRRDHDFETTLCWPDNVFCSSHRLKMDCSRPRRPHLRRKDRPPWSVASKARAVCHGTAERHIPCERRAHDAYRYAPGRTGRESHFARCPMHTRPTRALHNWVHGLHTFAHSRAMPAMPFDKQHAALPTGSELTGGFGFAPRWHAPLPSNSCAAVW